MKTGEFIRRFYFLPFKWLYKFLILVMFIVYIIAGCQASWTLFKSALINLQDVTALHSIIEKNIRKDRIKSITEWVHRRPLSETETLIDIATPKSGYLESSIFFEFSNRLLRQGKTRDALFWAQLGRYRMRYDALRCGSLNSPEFFDKILSHFVHYKLIALMKLNPEIVKESVRQVLDFDAKYPARNNPTSICNVFNKLKRNGAPLASKDQWERIHRNLRMVTESFLENSDEK